MRSPSLLLDANVLFMTMMASKMLPVQLQLGSRMSGCARAELPGAGKDHGHFTNGAIMEYCR
jgi:hypothetical protein